MPGGRGADRVPAGHEPSPWATQDPGRQEGPRGSRAAPRLCCAQPRGAGPGPGDTRRGRHPLLSCWLPVGTKLEKRAMHLRKQNKQYKINTIFKRVATRGKRQLGGCGSGRRGRGRVDTAGHWGRLGTRSPKAIPSLRSASAFTEATWTFSPPGPRPLGPPQPVPGGGAQTAAPCPGGSLAGSAGHAHHCGGRPPQWLTRQRTPRAVGTPGQPRPRGCTPRGRAPRGSPGTGPRRRRPAPGCSRPRGCA